MAFYDTVRLEKGMYNTPGKSFTQVLEELDPAPVMKTQSLPAWTLISAS